MDRVEIVDEIALRRAGVVEQRLIEIRERDSVAFLAARRHLAPAASIPARSDARAFNRG